MVTTYALRSIFAVLVLPLGKVACFRTKSSATAHGPDVDGKPPPWDCKGWPNSGVCELCEATSEGFFASRIGARCDECPQGWALLAGPPIKLDEEKNLTSPIDWKSHCARMDGKERRVIMLRHGESIWNKVMEDTGKAAGAVGAFGVGYDSPLSSLGLRQAQRLSQVLKKAREEVYGPAVPSAAVLESDDFMELNAARSELGQVDLQDVLKIVDRSTRKVISDEEMVEHLAREEHREALDVLLGNKCEETNFVSSQLTRAMDTLLIGTMESRMTCPWPWMISSNLQEIEHNSDCSPAAQPFHQPEMAEGQSASYLTSGMRGTKDFIAKRYKASDVARFKKNYGQIERARWNDQSAQMLDEIQWMFESDKKFTVWGGHSIWFRHFFQRFGDLADPVCKQMTEIKMANTAILSFRLKSVDADMSPVGYAATDCKFVHLGSSNNYEQTLEQGDYLSNVPEPEDFNHGVTDIMGWKCCCSRSDYKDAKRRFITRKSLEICVLAKTAKCRVTSSWSDIWPKDLSFKSTAAKYHWGSNNGPCDVKVDHSESDQEIEKAATSLPSID